MRVDYTTRVNRLCLPRVLDRSATPAQGWKCLGSSWRCCTRGYMLFAPVPGRADQDREAALRAGVERQGNGRAGRQGQGRRQPRAETGTVVRVQRERVIPPVPAAAAEDRALDVHAVPLRPRGAGSTAPDGRDARSGGRASPCACPSRSGRRRWTRAGSSATGSPTP